LLVTLLLAGCPSSKEIRLAKTSAYDADFAIVYSETVTAVQELYPELTENPATGVIRTAWHQVSYSSSAAGARPEDNPATTGAATTAGSGAFTPPASSLNTKNFIRFDVVVAGGRPWHIRVTARASEWVAGNSEATELTGAATPHWLAGRRDALIVAIYRRLKEYAVHIDEAPVEDTGPAVPDVDPSTFGDIPKGAEQVAAGIVKAIDARDVGAIRPLVADDVEYSLGADGDADTAMATWQADPVAIENLEKVLRAGCRGDDKAVTCPPEATESPGYVGWRATIEPRGDSWKLTSFVEGD
jgi:hypothetical protein